MATNPFKLKFDLYLSNKQSYIESLKSWIPSNTKGYIAHLKRHHQDLLNYLNEKYSKTVGNNISEQLYWFVYDLKSFPLCKTCGKNPTRFRSFREGYANWCCNKCAQLDEHTIHKVQETQRKNNNGLLYVQTEKYHSLIGEIAKNRSKDELLKIRRKREKTCIERFGYSDYMKIPEEKERIGKLNKEKSKEYMELAKQRCREKYGCDYTGQIRDKIEKTKKTWNEKYGGCPFQMDTNGKRVIENILNLDFSKSRSRKYILVETQDGQFIVHRKSDKFTIPDSSKVTNFDSKWEIKVYVFCRKNNINVTYHPNTFFKYSFNGYEFIYEPDFLINGKLFEVKGDMFFKKVEHTGQETMQRPWKGKLSDEEYELKCKIDEEKHQCMLRNGVNVIRGKELKDLSSYFTEKLGSDIITSIEK